MTAKTIPAPWMTNDALEALRQRLEMSWTELADRLGVSYQTLLRIRQGRSHGINAIQSAVHREMMAALLLNRDQEVETDRLHCPECGGPVIHTGHPRGEYEHTFRYFQCDACNVRFRIMIDHEAEGNMGYRFAWGVQFVEVVNGR